MNKTLITNEMVNLVKDSLPNDTIVKIDFTKWTTFYIGRCKMTRDPEANVYLKLEEGFDKEYAELWKNDVGNVLQKELNKKDPEVYEVIDKRFRALIKKISEEEAESFAEAGLIHLQIGDALYTIIRIIKPSDLYSNKDYKNDYYEEDVECYSIYADDAEEEVEIERKSIRLF